MPRIEYQYKVEGVIDRSFLLSIGAEPLGHSNQKDIYLKGEHTRRIRKEDDQYLFTEKTQDIGHRARVKEVNECEISEEDADRYVKDSGVRITICKHRTFYRFRNTTIAQDDVEHLGQFIEIHSDSEDELHIILATLQLDSKRTIKMSYLDIVIAKQLPSWRQILIRGHDKVGEFVFGITSGVLTTVGVLVGVNSSGSSKLAVVASIVSIAVADSCSDAFGMYNTKAGERGTSKRTALRCAFSTLAGKMILPLTFLVPIGLLSLNAAVVFDCLAGVLVLSLLSAERAVIAEKPIFRSIGLNLIIGFIIVALSFGAGLMVRRLS